MIDLQVKDIMTRNVAYINPAATVTEAAQLMQKHNVGSIPVCDETGVVGIVTDRDIVVRNIAHGRNPHNTPVSEIMTTGVTTVTPETDVRTVSELMARHQIRRVPVVENNRLVGMVALGDLAVNAMTDTEVSEALAEISKPARPEQMPKK